MTIDKILKGKREEILRIGGSYGARNVQVFDPLAHGQVAQTATLTCW